MYDYTILIIFFYHRTCNKLKELCGFKYMEATFGRLDFEVWKILVAVILAKLYEITPIIIISVLTREIHINSSGQGLFYSEAVIIWVTPSKSHNTKCQKLAAMGYLSSPEKPVIVSNESGCSSDLYKNVDNYCQYVNFKKDWIQHSRKNPQLE